MIGKSIKELRSKRNITQEELAKVIGVTTSMVGMYETGARKPSFEVLNKIADYFNVSTDYLLGREHKGMEVLNESTKDLPALSPKDERDIAKDLGRTLANLESNEALAFEGEPLTEEDRELLKISLENSMRLAKQLAKKKFTPKKYKK